MFIEFVVLFKIKILGFEIIVWVIVSNCFCFKDILFFLVFMGILYLFGIVWIKWFMFVVFVVFIIL